MRYGLTQQQNHPQKGSSILVEPITDRTDIRRIKTLLSDKPRDLCLFTLGINTAYRANELLSLSVGQVQHLKAGDALRLKQSKNNKYRTTIINNIVYEALQNWLEIHPDPRDKAPLFWSQRTRKALGVSAVNHLVKKWCRTIKLQGNYGSHTLRKTWGYHQLRQNKETEQYILLVLMQAYGHHSPKQTLEYLCIQTNEIQSLYTDLEL